MDITLWTYSIVSVLIVSAVSMVGIVALSLSKKFLNKILLLLVSFAAGSLLGDVFIHILPEAFEEGGMEPLTISYLVLLGILAFFTLEKLIHWRHCHVVDEPTHPHPFAMVNLVGDAIHNVVDGVVIAVSYMVSIPVGIATTTAVLFHEIPQEIGDFGVLVHGGYSRARALVMNLLSGLGAVLGAVLALIVGSHIEHISWYLLPVAAGGFIYIACADLFPELHKESSTGKSVMQLASLTLGILSMMLLLQLE